MGNGAARMGNARWRRLTEERAGGAKSVFHFDVQGSVAKSTHAGIPWLRFIRQRLGERVHFWPFDGWDIPAGRSAIAEVYPSLWSRGFAREDRTGDQHDAFCIAAWLARADRDGRLAGFLKPNLTPPERAVAEVEGWILGVPGLIPATARQMKQKGEPRMSDTNDWMSLAIKIGRAGHEIFRTATVQVTAKGFSDEKVLALTLLARTMSNLKGALLLLQHKRIVEGRTIVRCCFENLYWVIALLEGGENFAHRMLHDEMSHKKARGQQILEVVPVPETAG